MGVTKRRWQVGSQMCSAQSVTRTASLDLESTKRLPSIITVDRPPSFPRVTDQQDRRPLQAPRRRQVVPD
jgi:hypothetical protein